MMNIPFDDDETESSEESSFFVNESADSDEDFNWDFDQMKLFEDPKMEILDLLEKDRNICICGPGGTGKSYTLREVAFTLIKQGKKIAVTATTGTAALNLKDGTSLFTSTLHRWAGVGLAKEQPSKLAQKIKSKKIARDKWNNTDILFVDEISMFGSTLLDKLSEVGKMVRNNFSEPFGGLRLVFCGDFLQLPPVGEPWIFRANCWDKINFEFVNFNKPQRFSSIDYFDFLNRIRIGNPSDSDIQHIMERYNECKTMKKNKKGKIIPTIVHSKKVDVGAYNQKELSKIKSPTFKYVAKDSIEAISEDEDEVEYLSPADEKSFSNLLCETIPQVIELKVGAQVMLKVNLDPVDGLVNGSRGIVVDLDDHTVTVQFNNNLPPLEVSNHIWDAGTNKIIATRSQIPLILAWAITIHKSQGSSLDCAMIDLGPSVFAEGQAYVALSRVKSMNGLYVSNFTPHSIKADKQVLKFMEENKLL